MNEVIAGACRFCGQANINGLFDKNISLEDAEEQATLKCNCCEAEIYQKITSAKNNINILFGKGSEEYGMKPTESEKVIEHMNQVVELIADETILNATIQITARTKAKFSLTAKGAIKIERSETKKYQLEK